MIIIDNNKNMSLNDKLNELEDRYEKINTYHKTLKNKINEIENYKKDIIQQIYKIKQDLELPNVTDLVKKIDVDELLSNDEIIKIYDGMDKTKYYDVDNKDIKRWLDLERITKQVIKVKNKYHTFGFVLQDVKKTFSEERCPPTNYYILGFKDNEGLYFSF